MAMNLRRSSSGTLAILGLGQDAPVELEPGELSVEERRELRGGALEHRPVRLARLARLARSPPSIAWLGYPACPDWLAWLGSLRMIVSVTVVSFQAPARPASVRAASPVRIGRPGWARCG